MRFFTVLIVFFFAATFFVSCKDDSESSTSDSGTTPDSGSDECDDPLYGFEFSCDTQSNPCPCDYWCNDQAMEWWGAASYYTETFCYTPCGEGDACPGENDVCVGLAEGEDGTGPVHNTCLPKAQVTADTWQAPLFTPGDAITAADTLPINVSITVDGEAFNAVAAYGYDNATQCTSGTECVILYFMEGMQPDGVYMVYLDIPKDNWEAGTLVAGDPDPYDEDTDSVEPQFTAHLLRLSVPDGVTQSDYMAGMLMGGSIEITQATDLDSCGAGDQDAGTGDGGTTECPPAAGGAIDLHFVKFKAKMPPQ